MLEVTAVEATKLKLAIRTISLALWVCFDKGEKGWEWVICRPEKSL